MNRLLAGVTGLCLMAATAVYGAMLKNTSFETDFGSRDDQAAWGDFGDVWGEAYQVAAGTGNYVKKANTGDRVLLINVPGGTWNGAWQQIPWDGGKPFIFSGYYLIQGGSLPENCPTFLKVEFYDGDDKVVGELEGPRLRADTGKKWEQAVLTGTPPKGTRAIRFVVIAGDNAGNDPVENRIFWDDVDVKE